MLRAAGAEHQGQREDKEPDNQDKRGEKQQKQQQDLTPVHRQPASLSKLIRKKPVPPSSGEKARDSLQSSHSWALLEPGVHRSQEIPLERALP